MSPQGAALIWCPFADEASARQVAGALLDEGLIACANILPDMISLYVWKEERHEEQERGVIFKTDAALLHKAIARLVELHPYEAPAAIGWRADGAAPATLEWLGSLLP